MPGHKKDIGRDIGRIGVLMGGASSEREISLKSGEAVTGALREEGCDVLPLDIDGNFGDVRKILEEARINVAFIALHGRFGEDGTIQKLLESLNIPYTGSGAKASSLALDKLASRKVFKEAGIVVPEYRVVTRQGCADSNGFHFPLIVKPSSQGSSIGLSLVENEKDLSPAVELALSYNNEIIVEEYIRGEEVTVGILDDKALPLIQIVPKRRFYDYQAKYEVGMSDYCIAPSPIGAEYLKAQETALLAHRCLGCCAFSRADMIIRKGEPVVLEVNTIPGLTFNSLLPKAAFAAGINFSQLCLRLIETAMSAINGLTVGR